MAATVFTPKQIAQALGVSESSVKRWVDSGKLPAARTGGGHRKVPLPSIVEFVRVTGHELAEPEVLGMAAASQRGTLETSQEPLYEALIHGRESACRELVLAFYQQGEQLTAIGDRLIAPVFRQIGDNWATGEVKVHQERRSCEVMMATLHELRRWLPAAAQGAPKALVATPELDFSEVPIRLVELSLVAEGWDVIPAGSGLPLSEIRDAVLMRRPRLVCLSVTHLEDRAAFITGYNAVLLEETRHALGDASSDGVSHVIGGGALCGIEPDLKCDLFAATLEELKAYQARVFRPIA